MKRTKKPGINQGAQKQHKRAQIRVLKNQKVISKNVSQTFRQKKQMQQILQRAPSSGEAQADAHSYSGEDEEEGGWIEDVTEDGQNDRR